jgi:urease accessory protein
MISYSRGPKLFWLTFAVALGVPPVSHAHFINTGFGPFYDGLAHLLVSPEDFLPVIALALFAGLRGPRFGRIVLFGLPLAWLVGAAAASVGIPPLIPPVTMTLVTLALGLLLAVDKPLPPALMAGIAILLGVLHGSADGSELARTESSEMVTIGTAVAILIIVSLLAGQAASMRALWARVALRVVGSWIAAIGIFMLGWSLRGTS